MVCRLGRPRRVMSGKPGIGPRRRRARSLDLTRTLVNHTATRLTWLHIGQLPRGALDPPVAIARVLRSIDTGPHHRGLCTGPRRLVANNTAPPAGIGRPTRPTYR